MAAQTARAVGARAVCTARQVRRMAAYAGGYGGGALGPAFNRNDLAMHVLELGVALLARGREVLSRDRGAVVGEGKDVVRRVTRHAGRRPHQSLLGESPVN